MTSSVPPAPSEEKMKKRDDEYLKVEATKKSEDEDAMDVEQTSSKHANEHPLHHPPTISTDSGDAEDVPRER